MLCNVVMCNCAMVQMRRDLLFSLNVLQVELFDDLGPNKDTDSFDWSMFGFSCAGWCKSAK